MVRRRRAEAAASVLALLVLAAASVAPAAPSGGALLAPLHDQEGCIETTAAPGATPGPQAGSCEGTGAIAGLLPLVAIVVAAALVIGLIGGVLVFRLPPRILPESVDGWWTCVACGGSNLHGSPRCHKCGTWRPTIQPSPRSRTTP